LPVAAYQFYDAFLRLFLKLFKFCSSSFLNFLDLLTLSASTAKILISNPPPMIIITNKAIFVNADNSNSESTSLVSVDTSCFGSSGAT